MLPFQPAKVSPHAAIIDRVVDLLNGLCHLSFSTGVKQLALWGRVRLGRYGKIWREKNEVRRQDSDLECVDIYIDMIHENNRKKLKGQLNRANHRWHCTMRISSCARAGE